MAKTPATKTPAKPAAKPSVITSVRLPADVKLALEVAATAEERSVSWLVGKVMADWLRAKKYLGK